MEVDIHQIDQHIMRREEIKYLEDRVDWAGFKPKEMVYINHALDNYNDYVDRGYNNFVSKRMALKDVAQKIWQDYNHRKEMRNRFYDTDYH